MRLHFTSFDDDGNPENVSGDYCRNDNCIEAGLDEARRARAAGECDAWDLGDDPPVYDDPARPYHCACCGRILTSDDYALPCDRWTSDEDDEERAEENDDE